jgi:calcineurin-like phosphoesterase family protein
VQNHADILKPGDILYHLGDYGFGLIPCLNPQVYRTVYLKGNHDRGAYWTGTPETIVIEAYGHRIHLSHHIDEYLRHDGEYDIYLCGHVHDRWTFHTHMLSTIINVGVDAWNFKPISIREVIKFHKRIQNGRES